ncbi:hypothetical protein BDV95DRAFT_592338 [Massariosphaeria phaeospora]|uniref:Uncharacterized protein n=1 Tax=Massariosphaeria phaeospora TaxID=100035 RepID=A0A7C8IDA3_9PLEO|nr:hypothetical protein BDV95DRAFT_592338 [Massariosphaeria phaeospora]
MAVASPHRSGRSHDGGSRDLKDVGYSRHREMTSGAPPGILSPLVACWILASRTSSQAISRSETNFTDMSPSQMENNTQDSASSNKMSHSLSVAVASSGTNETSDQKGNDRATDTDRSRGRAPSPEDEVTKLASDFIQKLGQKQ